MLFAAPESPIIRIKRVREAALLFSDKFVS